MPRLHERQGAGAALVWLFALVRARAATFCNPLNLDYRFQLDEPSRREAADPTMVVFDGQYWLFASKSGGYWHSRDLVQWTLIEPTGLPLEDYAPTVVEINGTLYFTAFSSAAIFSTRDPLRGKWTKVANLSQYYDPALFLDDDGSVYVAFGCSNNDATHMVQLDPSAGWIEVGERLAVARGNGSVHGWETPGDENELDGTPPWIEGSWINKWPRGQGGKYYFQYAGPSTQYKSYGDGVLVSDHALGPYTRDADSPFAHKPNGFAAGAGHGSTFQDVDGRWWHVGTITISVRHKFERRIGLFPLELRPGQGPGGAAALRMNGTLGDYPMSSADGSHPPWMLLSYLKPATASSTYEPPPFNGSTAHDHACKARADAPRHLRATNASAFATDYGAHYDARATDCSPTLALALDYSPARAVDEDLRTWWSAASGAPGEWISIDLGAPVMVHAIQLNFAEQNSTALGKLPLSDACRYYVEYTTGSEGGKVGEGSKGGATDEWLVLPALDRRPPAVVRDAPHDYVELPQPTAMRQVRVTNVHTPAGALFSLSGVRVFGLNPAAQPPPPVAGLAVVRAHDDARQASVSWYAPPAPLSMHLVRYGVAATALGEADLYHSFQVDGRETSVRIRALSVGVEYLFVVDALNEAGRTVGTQLVRA